MRYTMEMINAIGIQIIERLVQIGTDQGLEIFLCKRRTVSILGFAFHTVSVTTIQLHIIVQKSH